MKYSVKTLANTGLRISELINLKLEDVDLNNRFVKVIEGKGFNNRVVPINMNLYKDSKRYKEEIRPNTNSNYFFPRKGQVDYLGNGLIKKQKRQ